MLVIMNIVAIIPVVLDKKLLADLDDIKLSWDAPKPKAPPSDFCKRITLMIDDNLDKKLRVLQTKKIQTEQTSYQIYQIWMKNIFTPRFTKCAQKIIEK